MSHHYVKAVKIQRSPKQIIFLCQRPASKESCLTLQCLASGSPSRNTSCKAKCNHPCLFPHDPKEFSPHSCAGAVNPFGPLFCFFFPSVISPLRNPGSAGGGTSSRAPHIAAIHHPLALLALLPGRPSASPLLQYTNTLLTLIICFQNLKNC